MGHIGGKVLVPAGQFIHAPLPGCAPCRRRLGVPTVLIARTDTLSARLLHGRRRRAGR